MMIHLEGEVLEVSLELRLDLLALLLVLALELLRLPDHALHILVGQARVVLDDNVVLAARGAVLGADVHDALNKVSEERKKIRQLHRIT